MARVAFVAAFLIGCGRIGFDPIGDGGHGAAGRGSGRDARDGGLESGTSGGGTSGGGTSGGGTSGGGTSGGGTSVGGASIRADSGATALDARGGAPAAADSGGVGVDGGGGADAGSPPAPRYCSVVPALGQPAKLDGVLDPGMVLVPVNPVGWRNQSAPLPSGQSMRYAVGWRPDGVYFFVEVTDPDRNIASPSEFIWQGDAVELYVDHDASFDTPPPNYDAVGTRQLLVEAPAVDGGSGTRAEVRIPETYTPWKASAWRSEARAFGYVVEAFVDASALALPTWKLTAGQRIGIDLAHDVSYPPGKTGPDGARLSQYFLNVADPLTGSDSADYPFFNEAVFCTPVLQ